MPASRWGRRSSRCAEGQWRTGNRELGNGEPINRRHDIGRVSIANSCSRLSMFFSRFLLGARHSKYDDVSGSFSRMGEGQDEGDEIDRRSPPCAFAAQTRSVKMGWPSACVQIPLTLILSHPGEETFEDTPSLFRLAVLTDRAAAGRGGRSGREAGRRARVVRRRRRGTTGSTAAGPGSWRSSRRRSTAGRILSRPVSPPAAGRRGRASSRPGDRRRSARRPSAPTSSCSPARARRPPSRRGSRV